MKRAVPPKSVASGAFTFVEVFAAMIFLAILVPAITEGLSIANRASVVAQRSAIAGQLAENKLNELVLAATTGTNGAASSTAITSDSSSGTSAGNAGNSGNTGDFGADYPGFRWEANQDTWDQDSINTMTVMSVQVYFKVQGLERSVTLSTLVSGTTQSQSSL